MADKKIIAATLQVDTGSSNANIKEVNKNLNEVKSNLKETGTSATNTGKQLDTSSGSFKNLKGQISTLPGPLGQAGDGVTKLGTTFKALLANPIVLLIAAIVAGLALLYKAFTNTFEGGQKMEQVFAGIKAAAQALLDNLSRVARAVNDLFHFRFGDAIDEIKGVAKAAGEAYEAMAKLTQQAQNLARKQADNDLDQAKRARDLAILREQSTDESVPIAQRKAALKELQDIAKQNAQDDIQLAKETAENQIAQLTLEKDGANKNYVEIQKIKADQIKVETDNANELRRIGKQITSTEKQEIAERRAANAERNQERKKEIQEAKALELKLIEDNYLATLNANEKLFELERRKHEENLKILKKGNQDTFAETVRHNTELNALTAKSLIDSVGYTAKLNDAITAGATSQIKPRQDIVINQTQLELDNANARMTIATLETEHKKAQIQETAGLLSQLADIVGRQTVAGKALAIATALINTYQGASEALKQKSTLPSPFDVVAKIVNVAAVIATGIKTVKAITAVQVPGGGGGGGSIGSAPIITPSAPIAPTQTATALDQNSINSIGNATSNRTYVLDSDVANNRERDVRLNRAARLGG